MLFFNGGCIFILITLYNVVPSKEDTEASDSNEDVDEQQEPEPELILLILEDPVVGLLT